MDAFSFMLGFIAGIAACVVLMIMFFLLKPWLNAIFSGAAVPLGVIIGMRLRGNPPKLLIDAYATMIQSGEKTSIADVESVYIANRNQATDIDSLVRLVQEHERDKKSV
jgi:uncharacterized protein YqfA (UPF0365 family)